MSESPGDITQRLRELGDSRGAAADELFRLVYDELRRIAAAQLRKERPGHTLTPTALVHEAYMKLVDQTRVDWKNRAHFFAISARAMRRILIDYARKRRAAKRGGGEPLVTLGTVPDERTTRLDELLALDEALDRLHDLDERRAKVVELRFFAGLRHREVGEALGVSEPTVRRDWRLARAWLSTQLQA